MRSILFAAFVATTALAASAGVAMAQTKTLKVGVITPISGPASYFGVMNKQGWDLALEQLKGEVNGVKMELTIEDSQCSPLGATQTVKRLLETVKPDIILGEECSDASLAVLPIITQAQVPLLNAGSSTAKLTNQGSKYVFRIFPDEAMQGESLAKNAYNRLKARKAVILHENTNAGIGNAAEFSKVFTAIGGEIVQRIGFDRSVNDFTPIATRIASLGAVDVIFSISLEGQGVRITQALEQAKVVRGGGGKAIQIGTIWLPAGFDEKAGRGAQGYIRIVQFDPNGTNPVALAFVKAFKAKYGEDKIPTHINAHAYDQIMLLADVVKRGGTDAKSIRDKLAETKNYRGTTGIVSFDAKGQNTHPSTMHYVETGADLKWRSLNWN
ncbi:MAG: ABC transporter substrate-binding protein [Burkholderiales bacterium]